MARSAGSSDMGWWEKRLADKIRRKRCPICLSPSRSQIVDGATCLSSELLKARSRTCEATAGGAEARSAIMRFLTAQMTSLSRQFVASSCSRFATLIRPSLRTGSLTSPSTTTATIASTSKPSASPSGITTRSGARSSSPTSRSTSPTWTRSRRPDLGAAAAAVLPTLGETAGVTSQLTAAVRARIVDILAASDDKNAGKVMLDVLQADVPAEVRDKVMENLKLFLPGKWQRAAWQQGADRHRSEDAHEQGPTRSRAWA